MDGFKNTTKTKYITGDAKPLYRDRDLVTAVSRKLDPKGSVMAGEVKPLYRDRDLVTAVSRKLDPKGSVTAGDTARYAKGGSVKGEAKMAKVMGEFAAGKLHSGSKKGPEVKNPKQAVAIAMSEARKAGAKMPVKKGEGGGIFNERGQRATPAEVAAEGRRMENRSRPVEGISTRPTDDRGRRMTDAELNIVRVTAKKTLPKSAVKTVQPVQKKGLGGILKAMSPAAAIIGSDVGKDLMKSGVFGVGGLLASQLMKKKQSGQPLTDAETKQLAQAPQTAMRKGGPVKKGVPVAPKGPMVGLATMPKKK